MTMTQEERAAMAARLVEKRKKLAEQQGVLEQAELAQRRSKARGEARRQRSGSIDVDLAELKVLNTLKRELLETLRKPDEDGVKPPELRHVKRFLRKDYKHDTLNGEHGPQQPRLVEARIHVAMLMCYQNREPRGEVARKLKEKYGVRAVLLVIARYSTDDELAYNPYAYNSKTYAQLLREFRERDIGIRDVFPDDHPIRNTDELTMICLKGLGHADWNARMTTYLYGRLSGCPACAKLRMGRRMK